MQNSNVWFFGKRTSLVIALVVVFLAALGIRFYDLTDLPLDFHANRQLFSALKARGMYYEHRTDVPAWQRDLAVKQWKDLGEIEPPVMERLVAATYGLFGEHLWIARIYSLFFWVLGGLFVYLLARGMTSRDGAVLALLFYLFLPYGVLASRSFQPDPLMVALIAAALWALWRWRESATWEWTVTAGLLMGAAIFVKNVAVFFLGPAALALVLERGFLPSVKDRKTWALAGLAVLPVALYTAYGLWIAGFLGQQFTFRFFPLLWKDPAFYLRWKEQLDAIISFGAFLLAFAGILLANRRASALLAGLWLGYFVYGMTFAYHISTHDYYSLPAVLLAALSLAPLAALVAEKIEQVRAGWLARAVTGLIVLVVLGLQMWTARVEMARSDFRADADLWWMLGEKLGHSDPSIGLTQDYGYRLAYWGFQDITSWYYSGDLYVRDLKGRDIDLLERFHSMIEGKHYFIVTQMGDLAKQPKIKALLVDTYPVYDQGDGWIIFDLTRPKMVPAP
jgi:4-amino-4-deoxy-L-arabinose transferase-like glycosyltransferase